MSVFTIITFLSTSIAWSAPQNSLNSGSRAVVKESLAPEPFDFEKELSSEKIEIYEGLNGFLEYTCETVLDTVNDALKKRKTIDVINSNIESLLTVKTMKYRSDKHKVRCEILYDLIKVGVTKKNIISYLIIPFIKGGNYYTFIFANKRISENEKNTMGKLKEMPFSPSAEIRKGIKIPCKVLSIPENISQDEKIKLLSKITPMSSDEWLEEPTMIVSSSTEFGRPLLDVIVGCLNDKKSKLKSIEPLMTGHITASIADKLKDTSLNGRDKREIDEICRKLEAIDDDIKGPIKWIQRDAAMSSEDKAAEIKRIKGVLAKKEEGLKTIGADLIVASLGEEKSDAIDEVIKEEKAELEEAKEVIALIESLDVVETKGRPEPAKFLKDPSQYHLISSFHTKFAILMEIIINVDNNILDIGGIARIMGVSSLLLTVPYFFYFFCNLSQGPVPGFVEWMSTNFVNMVGVPAVFLSVFFLSEGIMKYAKKKLKRIEKESVDIIEYNKNIHGISKELRKIGDIKVGFINVKRKMTELRKLENFVNKTEERLGAIEKRKNEIIKEAMLTLSKEEIETPNLLDLENELNCKEAEIKALRTYVAWLGPESAAPAISEKKMKKKIIETAQKLSPKVSEHELLMERAREFIEEGRGPGQEVELSLTAKTIGPTITEDFSDAVTKRILDPDNHIKIDITTNANSNNAALRYAGAAGLIPIVVTGEELAFDMGNGTDAPGCMVPDKANGVTYFAITQAAYNSDDATVIRDVNLSSIHDNAEFEALNDNGYFIENDPVKKELKRKAAHLKGLRAECKITKSRILEGIDKLSAKNRYDILAQMAADTQLKKEEIEAEANPYLSAGDRSFAKRLADEVNVRAQALLAEKDGLKSMLSRLTGSIEYKYKIIRIYTKLQSIGDIKEEFKHILLDKELNPKEKPGEIEEIKRRLAEKEEELADISNALFIASIEKEINDPIKTAIDKIIEKKKAEIKEVEKVIAFAESLDVTKTASVVKPAKFLKDPSRYSLVTPSHAIYSWLIKTILGLDSNYESGLTIFSSTFSMMATIFACLACFSPNSDAIVRVSAIAMMSITFLGAMIALAVGALVPTGILRYTKKRLKPMEKKLAKAAANKIKYNEYNKKIREISEELIEIGNIDAEFIKVKGKMLGWGGLEDFLNETKAKLDDIEKRKNEIVAEAEKNLSDKEIETPNLKDLKKELKYKEAKIEELRTYVAWLKPESAVPALPEKEIIEIAQISPLPDKSESGALMELAKKKDTAGKEAEEKAKKLETSLTAKTVGPTITEDFSDAVTKRILDPDNHIKIDITTNANSNNAALRYARAAGLVPIVVVGEELAFDMGNGTDAPGCMVPDKANGVTYFAITQAAYNSDDETLIRDVNLSSIHDNAEFEALNGNGYFIENDPVKKELKRKAAHLKGLRAECKITKSRILEGIDKLSAKNRYDILAQMVADTQLKKEEIEDNNEIASDDKAFAKELADEVKARAEILLNEKTGIEYDQHEGLNDFLEHTYKVVAKTVKDALKAGKTIDDINSDIKYLMLGKSEEYQSEKHKVRCEILFDLMKVGVTKNNIISYLIIPFKKGGNYYTFIFANKKISENEENTMGKLKEMPFSPSVEIRTDIRIGCKVLSIPENISQDKDIAYLLSKAAMSFDIDQWLEEPTMIVSRSTVLKKPLLDIIVGCLKDKQSKLESTKPLISGHITASIADKLKDTSLSGRDKREIDEICRKLGAIDNIKGLIKYILLDKEMNSEEKAEEIKKIKRFLVKEEEKLRDINTALFTASLGEEKSDAIDEVIKKEKAELEEAKEVIALMESLEVTKTASEVTPTKFLRGPLYYNITHPLSEEQVGEDNNFGQVLIAVGFFGQILYYSATIGLGGTIVPLSIMMIGMTAVLIICLALMIFTGMTASWVKKLIRKVLPARGVEYDKNIYRISKELIEIGNIEAEFNNVLINDPVNLSPVRYLLNKTKKKLDDIEKRKNEIIKEAMQELPRAEIETPNLLDLEKELKYKKDKIEALRTYIAWLKSESATPAISEKKMIAEAPILPLSDESENEALMSRAKTAKTVRVRGELEQEGEIVMPAGKNLTALGADVPHAETNKAIKEHLVGEGAITLAIDFKKPDIEQSLTYGTAILPDVESNKLERTNDIENGFIKNSEDIAKFKEKMKDVIGKLKDVTIKYPPNVTNKDLLDAIETKGIFFYNDVTIGNDVFAHSGMQINVPIGMVLHAKSDDIAKLLLEEAKHIVLNDPYHKIIKHDEGLRRRLLSVALMEGKRAEEIARGMEKAMAMLNIRPEKAMKNIEAVKLKDPGLADKMTFVYLTVDPDFMVNLDKEIGKRNGKKNFKVIPVYKKSSMRAFNYLDEAAKKYGNILFPPVDIDELKTYKEEGELLEEAAINYAGIKFPKFVITGKNIGWINSADTDYMIDNIVSDKPNILVMTPRIPGEDEINNIGLLLDIMEIGIMARQRAGDAFDTITFAQLAEYLAPAVKEQFLLAVAELGLGINDKVADIVKSPMSIQNVDETLKSNIISEKAMITAA